MSTYALCAFTDLYHEWADREQPSADWREVVLDWVMALEEYVFDDSVKDMWRGMNAWTARISLAGDRERVVTCVYDVHKAPRTALCRWLRFAPYYDLPDHVPDGYKG